MTIIIKEKENCGESLIGVLFVGVIFFSFFADLCCRVFVEDYLLQLPTPSYSLPSGAHVHFSPPSSLSPLLQHTSFSFPFFCSLLILLLLALPSATFIILR